MSTVTELSSNYDLVFPRSGVTDYAVIDRMYDNLTEVAVAVWIKTDDHENYGTVLSYATPEFDNALCLTDYNGWVIGIATRRSVPAQYLCDLPKKIRCTLKAPHEFTSKVCTI